MPIFKNEPSATERVASEIPVYLDGRLESGVTFEHGTAVVGMTGVAKEVEVWNGAAFVEASSDATEDGASGIYRYQFSQAEVNIDTVAIVRFAKTAWVAQDRDPVYCYVPIVPARRTDGLLHENSRDDNHVYDVNNNLTSCRKRVFASAAACSASTVGADDDADGEVARYTLTFAYAAGLLSSFKWVRDL